MYHNVIKFVAPKSVEDAAAGWLIRMDGDPTLSPEEIKEFQLWINEDPKHRQEFFSLAEVWDDVPVEEIHKLLSEKAGQVHKTKAPKKQFFRPAYVFCSLLLMVSLGFYFNYQNSTSNDALVYTSNGVYMTNIGEQQTLTLDDGSIISLNTNSRVQVDYNEQNRNVWLVYGEAHFEVAKDPAKPFRVYATGGRVEAVGTAFNIDLSNSMLDVMVTEGRVALAAIADKLVAEPFSQTKTNKDLSKMDSMLSAVGTLDAGQRIKLDSIYQGAKEAGLNTYKIETLSVQEMQRRQAWRTGVLIFEGQTMSEFVHEVSRFTHASFIINDPEVANIKVGGRYKIDKLDQVIVALEESFDIEVTQVNQNTYLLNKKH